MGIDETFERELTEEFETDAAAARVVARQARDLADSGRFETDMGRELTAGVAVENLRDAPGDLGLPEKWNWWIGALELAYGEYEQFRVLRWAGRSE